MSQDNTNEPGPTAESPTGTLGDEAPTPEAGFGDRDSGLEVGQVLGERYQIRSFLGRGGMGEVWRAFDLKLRVEVALKAMRATVAEDQARLELLRSEVRAAREVTSPNVCRIYDLVELDGTELVSMEYVDGTTLLDVMRKKSPMDPPEAQEMASQFLAGLEAIHQAGLVHRDVKPENIMVTRTGRVLLMDFGLARSSDEGAGSVSGTPAYMAPEQARGETDARSDLFSAGVILAEMVSPDGVRDFESRQSVWNGIRSEPVQVPDSPWASVVKRAVAKNPDERFQTAHELTLALEEVAFRVHDETGLEPYPGLASFDEGDAEYFFGREAEVEAVWTKLQTTQLLGIIGASGAGKSSFLGAGLLPSKPDGWVIARCSPGDKALDSLRESSYDEIKEDSETVKRLAAGGDQAIVEGFGSWREKHEHALLIVDQFEELFTQNTEEVQARVAEVIGRIALDADVRVLLSVRDDFLLRCHDHEQLAPIFSELTPLKPPIGGALRRAVVQPALRCGYRFEDEELADEILAEVEGERGALPLLAFALARLWEKRDRENGLITRQAYLDIGGVGGALAQHAESLMEKLGPKRHWVVREIFRNLVTAQGTRTARDVDELLSVFRGESERSIPGDKPPGRMGLGGGKEEEKAGRGFTPRQSDAEEVLRALIDARLLTSYEVPSDDGPGKQRVEVIHESLLRSWPRLVRWQTQDAEGAQLRDELRQAARAWDEHDRPDDRLWTGTAFREYQLWRERYPGGLTETEEDFGEAMTRHAERRKRRRRIAVSATFVILLGVLAIIGGFWRRSVTEARRAEAANLFSLAQLRLEEHPTATVAYTIASLELADNPEVRRLALDALWRGPTEFRLQTPSQYSLDFSSDGRWLLTATPKGGGLLWPSDGGPPTALEKKETSGEGRISPNGDVVAFNRRWVGPGESLLWSLPDGRFLRSLALGGTFNQNFWFSRDGERLITSTENLEGDSAEVMIRSWPLDGGEPDLLARLEVPKESLGTFFGVDPTESLLGWVDGSRFNMAPLEGMSLPPTPSASLEHDRVFLMAVFDDEGRRLATTDSAGTIRIWSLDHDPPELTRTVAGMGIQNPWSLRFDASGTMIGTSKGYLANLTAPPDAEPLRLRRPGTLGYAVAFHPESLWLATGGYGRSVSLWPLARPYPNVFRGHEQDLTSVQFTPDGRWIASTAEDGTVRLWPLDSSSGQRSRILYQAKESFDIPRGLAMAPDGSFLAVGTYIGQVWVLPLDGGPSRELIGFTDVINPVAVDLQSRLVAGGAGSYDREQAIVRVWDLESEEVRILDAGDGEQIKRLEFTDDGDLWVASGPKIRRWNLEGGDPRIMEEINLSRPEFASDRLCDLDSDGRQVLLWKAGRLWIQDLDTYDSRELSSHAGSMPWCSLDAASEIVVSSDALGAVRVGPVTGGEPHLLLGHEPWVYIFAISPDGRWIATGGDDGTIRLWPMPDFSKPPLHTLPHDELLAKLRSLTNLRVVRDEESSTGWKLEVGPFPGWETVPTW